MFLCACACACVCLWERERVWRDKIRPCVTRIKGSNPYNEWHLDTSASIELLKFGKLQVKEWRPDSNRYLLVAISRTHCQLNQLRFWNHLDQFGSSQMRHFCRLTRFCSTPAYIPNLVEAIFLELLLAVLHFCHFSNKPHNDSIRVRSKHHSYALLIRSTFQLFELLVLC